MILRRIAQHMKQQHWTGVFIELVIVVLGVFIGLQVDNWNQARQDHAAERVYLHALVRDLDTIESSVQGHIDFEDANAHYVKLALDTMAEPASHDRQMRLAMILSRLTRRQTYKLSSPTFQELQSTGRLGLISDATLRGMIVNYFHRNQRDQSAIDENNKTFIDNGFVVFLRSHGVAFNYWGAKRMSQTPAAPSTDKVSFEQVIKSYYGKRLPLADSPVLSSPPDAPFWHQLRIQLDWRAYLGAGGKFFAMLEKTRTRDLKARISEYLHKHRG